MGVFGCLKKNSTSARQLCTPKCAFERLLKAIMTIFRTTQQPVKRDKFLMCGEKCCPNSELSREFVTFLSAVSNTAYNIVTNNPEAVKSQPLVRIITYISIREGWLYPWLLFWLYTRRIVGWAMSDRMTSDLTVGALRRPSAIFNYTAF